MTTRSPTNRLPRPTDPAWAAIALATLGALAGPSAAATFITVDRTVAGHNPIDGNYSGQGVFVGVDGAFNRVANVQVDVIDPAQLNYSDQTGGGLAAYSNSVVNVRGGSFGQYSPTGCCGGASANDTSRLNISGGTLDSLSVNGAAAGAAGAHANVSGGLIQNYRRSVAVVANGVLNMSGGTISSSAAQPALVGEVGGVVNIGGGLVQSVSGAAIIAGTGSALTLSGGTVSGLASRAFGIVLDDAGMTADLRGGTINGGLRADHYSAASPALQANLSGSLTLNGGAFALRDAALDIRGGSYTAYADSDAQFFALGSNNLNFYGNGLTLSGPTAGRVFMDYSYDGNFYTFTAGTFSGGQSAVGLRVFDALSFYGSTAGMGGGVTLTAAVPEPGEWALLLAGLGVLSLLASRRRRTD